MMLLDEKKVGLRKRNGNLSGVLLIKGSLILLMMPIQNEVINVFDIAALFLCTSPVLSACFLISPGGRVPQ